jgi:hypothetical protein
MLLFNELGRNGATLDARLFLPSFRRLAACCAQTCYRVRLASPR